MGRRKRICHARRHLLPTALRQPIKGVCAILAGGGGQDVIEALLSDQECPPAGAYVRTQCGAAEVLIGPDLFEAGGLVRGAFLSSLDHFEELASGRRVGFPFARVMALTPWFAAVEMARGVDSDHRNQPARHPEWVVKGRIGWVYVAEVLEEAGRFEAEFR